MRNEPRYGYDFEVRIPSPRMLAEKPSPGSYGIPCW